MRVPRITTSRLTLRRWRSDDIEPFAALCGDPEVMRYIGPGETRTTSQAAASIDAFERMWDERRYGLFAVELTASGRLIGFAGLSEPHFLPEIMPAVEIGWRFARDTWGKGYATEAARAALDFGLVKLGLPEIVSIHQVGNDASGNIMRKLGMRFDRETVDQTCGRPVHIYRTCAIPAAGHRARAEAMRIERLKDTLRVAFAESDTRYDALTAKDVIARNPPSHGF
jgi:RimJ/RimL family protein N-acetyltransferase